MEIAAPVAVAEESAKPAPRTRRQTESDASNDSAPKDYETVNEPPANKKKGWWNKLTD